jgi:peptidoglycan/LPS O-acetylase OafA/YrhL
MTTLGFTMLYLGYGVILLALVYAKPGTGPIGKALAIWPSRAVAFVGFYSYSIYLWQEDLARNFISRHLLHRLRDVPTNAYWPAVETLHLIFAIGAGILMARLIEIPSLALRDRIFPARTPRIAIKPTLAVEAAPIPASNRLVIPIPDEK